MAATTKTVSQSLLTDIRERVTKDVHEKIVQKMVEGDVAGREAIERYFIPGEVLHLRAYVCVVVCGCCLIRNRKCHHQQGWITVVACGPSSSEPKECALCCLLHCP